MLLINRTKNWLPRDGIVNYYNQLLSQELANFYFKKLFETIEWENDKVNIFGKKIITKRKVAWYGEENYKYTYSNTSKYALPWTKEILELKILVEKLTNKAFNSCLLNLYHDGNEGMGWHSDAEVNLEKNGTIVSLSLGAIRKFVFKHKQTKEKVEILLEHGSLLSMEGTIQNNWLHQLPIMKKVSLPRVNLTFRTIID